MPINRKKPAPCSRHRTFGALTHAVKPGEKVHGARQDHFLFVCAYRNALFSFIEKAEAT
ncbi:hypothetical protein [Siminovitchia fordii]|uniref:hypothetical protein n=1 Tax=Siminovitchia fordii TaxID=254759 RepID=UPI00039CB1EA|nr:hypothetical protein [Siminovitchia fordii]